MTFLLLIEYHKEKQRKLAMTVINVIIGVVTIGIVKRKERRK